MFLTGNCEKKAQKLFRFSHVDQPNLGDFPPFISAVLHTGSQNDNTKHPQRSLMHQ